MRGISILLSKWDKRFVEISQLVSTWSKDPSRQIGAIAVRNRKILSTGYNGFPKGIEDTEARLRVREIKYQYVVHAEMNCIYNAAENGISLRDSTLYIYGLPVCGNCALGIIQAGVKRVVAISRNTPDRWKEAIGKTDEIFKEAGVKYEYAEI